MRFEVYGKHNCGRCESTKKKLSHVLGKIGFQVGAEVLFVDMDSVDGRAEGAFHDVHEVPTTIVRSAQGGELTRWVGDVPHSEVIKGLLAAQQV